MKRIEYLAHLQKSSVADIQTEIKDLERKIQSARMNIAFGKSKHVSDIRNLKRQLAQALTLGNQKAVAAAQAPMEKNHE